MPSYLDELQGTFDSAAEKLTRLEQDDFSPDQLRDMLAVVGAQAEVFLKVAAFPGGEGRRDFIDLINALGPAGLDAQHIQALHDLRRSYNAAKHDPTCLPTVHGTRSTLSAAKQAMLRIGALSIGRTNEQRPIALRRVFWILATDHYIGGDTEVSIVAQGDDGRGMPLDTIYISISSWEPALAELSAAGELRMGISNLPASVIDRYRGDDFLTAGAFEGTYRDLLRIFARRELRQTLLPGLNRHDDGFSILQSAVLAAIDVGRSAPIGEDLTTLAHDVVSLASSDYAVPADSEELERVAALLAGCLASVPAFLRPSLAGPSWIRRQQFERLTAISICSPSDAPFVLDSQAVFRLPLD